MRRAVDTGAEVARCSLPKTHRPKFDLCASIADGDMLGLCGSNGSLLRISADGDTALGERSAAFQFRTASNLACSQDTRVIALLLSAPRTLLVLRDGVVVLSKRVHWPVGLCEAVFLSPSAQVDSAFDNTARAHWCALVDNTRVALSADGAFLVMIVGELLVLVHLALALKGDEEPALFATHADDLARACGLKTPWHLNDVCVCPVTGQVFAIGGYRAASFSRSWFCAFAAQDAVKRTVDKTTLS